MAAKSHADELRVHADRLRQFADKLDKGTFNITDLTNLNGVGQWIFKISEELSKVIKK